MIPLNVPPDIRARFGKVMPSRPAPAVTAENLLADFVDPSTLPQTLRAHIADVGDILVGLELDGGIVRAAMAAQLVAAGRITPETLAARLDEEIVGLTRQVLALPMLDNYTGQTDAALPSDHAENLRKLLLAVVQDGRVILIRLADRLHELRAAKHAAPGVQRRIALTTREIYAPLANRLGIWQLKWELEDLAFRYLEPDHYRQVAAWLKDRRADREAYLHAAAGILRDKLNEAGITAEVAGRPKHIYSIWRKMQRKGLTFEEMYDILALRVLVDDVAGCYTALGIVHGLWRHIAKEFDDYIAAPKDNFYRSLHTAVMGPDARPLEIQIRTHEMHSHAEFGVASHWRYKEGIHYDPALETRIGWMRQLLAPGGDEDFIERFRTELVEERVYVLTPKGSVIDLPRGATALDFAYYVHTDVGHRCRGARLNGRLVPISHVLEDGDQVEIMTGRDGEPSRDWLNPHYGFLVTPRARDKLRAYFRQQDRGQNVSYGREMLERELERLALRDFRHDRLLKHFDFGSLEEIFAALGAGDLSSAQLAGALQRELAESRSVLPLKPARAVQRRSPHTTPVYLPGVNGDVLVSMARCCRPVPGESIRGYITQSHGISVHRKNCASLARLAARAPQRLTEVQWRDDGDYGQPVEITVEGQDRRNLLNDIMALLADEQLRLMALESRADSDDGMLYLRLTVGITGLPQLSRLLNRVMQIPSVIRAARAP